MSRGRFLFSLILVISLAAIVPAQAATIKVGAPCTSLGAIKSVSGQKLFCSFSPQRNAGTWQKVIPSSNKIKKGSDFYIYLNAVNECITNGASDYSAGDEVILADIVGGTEQLRPLATSVLYSREGGCSLGAYFKISEVVTGNQVLVYHSISEQIIGYFQATKNCRCVVDVNVESNPQDAILNQSAANFFIPGTSLITLQNVWGIKLNDAYGPKTFRQVADEIYIYLTRSIGHRPSQSELEISFQYGNSMQSFFSRLIDNTFAFQAMKDRLIFNSNQ